MTTAREARKVLPWDLRGRHDVQTTAVPLPQCTPKGGAKTSKTRRDDAMLTSDLTSYLSENNGSLFYFSIKDLAGLSLA